jgi:hypothetical protein
VVFGGRSRIGDVGPRARKDSASRAGGGLGGARPANSQGDPAGPRRRRGGAAQRRRIGRCEPLRMAPPGAHAFLALVLDLELDTTARGGLEGHGGVEEEAEKERQERAL